MLLITMLMYNVYSPGPDSNPRGGDQLPLTSGTRGEALTPNPNERNSTLTNGTNRGRAI